VSGAGAGNRTPDLLLTMDIEAVSTATDLDHPAWSEALLADQVSRPLPAVVFASVTWCYTGPLVNGQVCVDLPWTVRARLPASKRNR
jgi:hypothetical protein